jgi:hypothetical protein
MRRDVQRVAAWSGRVAFLAVARRPSHADTKAFRVCRCDIVGEPSARPTRRCQLLDRRLSRSGTSALCDAGPLASREPLISGGPFQMSPKSRSSITRGGDWCGPARVNAAVACRLLYVATDLAPGKRLAGALQELLLPLRASSGSSPDLELPGFRGCSTD